MLTLSCHFVGSSSFIDTCMKTKSFGQSSFAFTGPTQWNALPYEIRHCFCSCFQNCFQNPSLQDRLVLTPPLPPPPCLLHFIHNGKLYVIISHVVVCVCVYIYICVCVPVCMCVCVCVSPAMMLVVAVGVEVCETMCCMQIVNVCS